jgi:hypothetical protein
MNFFWYNPILSLNWCDNGNDHGAEQRGALAPSAGGKPLADGVFVGLRISPQNATDSEASSHLAFSNVFY